MTDAQAVPRTCKHDAGIETDTVRKTLRCLRCGKSVSLFDEAEAASLVTAPDLAEQIEAAMLDIDRARRPGEYPHLGNSGTVRRFAGEIADRLRAAASPTAHSAPPSEALREALAKIARLSDNHGTYPPAANLMIWMADIHETARAALVSSDRSAAPATPDARALNQDYRVCSHGVGIRAATPDASALRSAATELADELRDDVALACNNRVRFAYTRLRAALASGDTEPGGRA